MKTVAETTSKPLATPNKIIWIMPLPGVAIRFARALADTVQELNDGSVSYLRTAFLPDHARDWFPIRVVMLILNSAIHPIEIIRGVVAADAIEQKRRRLFLPV